MLSLLYILGLEKPDTLTIPSDIPRMNYHYKHNLQITTILKSKALFLHLLPNSSGSKPPEILPQPQQTPNPDVLPYHWNRHNVQPPYSKSSILTTAFTSVNQHSLPGLHTFLFPYPRKSTCQPCYFRQVPRCSHPTLHYPL